MSDYSAIAADPAWLAHRYDPQRDEFWFVRTERGERARIPFLTDEYLSADRDKTIVPRTSVTADASLPPLHFIFHSAYCCSTLLAQVFDAPGLTSSLKEPVVLNDIVGWRHRGGSLHATSAVLDIAMTTLARPFGTAEQAMIVKPSNVVNGLAPTMLRLRPSARALLLFAPLEAYLGSIARKGMWGRLWVRDLFRKQYADGMIDMGIPPADYIGLTDLQIAAVGWMNQMAQFSLWAKHFPDRVRTLDSDLFISRPSETLTALARFYELHTTEKQLDMLVQSPAFARNSKSGIGFSHAERAANRRRDLEIYAEEINMVATWANAVAKAAGFSLPPTSSLKF